MAGRSSLNSDASTMWPPSGRHCGEYSIISASCTDGQGPNRIAGSVICSTWSATGPPCWWPGSGWLATGAPGQPVWTRSPATTSRTSGVLPFLEDLRSSLRDGTFTALPVRQAAIPKKGGKVRVLGIPTLRDRVAQMALKLVLEPIFEVDFYPSSYGYRPGRRAQDAIAEIHHFTASRTYEWVIEGDIKACFDNVDHQVLMGLVAERITDRKVLRLVSAFLRAGILRQHGGFAETLTGTPQGGVASPLLANIYLSVLDRHFPAIWEQDMSPPWRRQHRRRKGLPNYRLVRYADDFVVLVHGTRSDAETLKAEIGRAAGRAAEDDPLGRERPTSPTSTTGSSSWASASSAGPDATAAGWCSPSRPSTRWRR